MVHDGGERTEHPWRWSVPVGVLVVVVLTYLLPEPPRGRDHLSGQLLLRVGLAVVAVALIARVGRWSWWQVPLVTGIAATCLGALPTLWEDSPAPTTDVTDVADATAAPAERRLVVPQRVEDWQQLENSRVERLGEQYAERLELSGGEAARDSLRYAFYVRDRRSIVSVVAYRTGDEVRAEVDESAETAARNFVAGATGDEYPAEVEPGDLGGGMACSEEGPQLPDGVVLCGWMDGTTAGQVSVQVPELTLDEAAGLARTFREAFTREQPAG